MKMKRLIYLMFCLLQISVTPSAVPSTKDVDNFIHLHGLQFSHVRDATVSLLTGAEALEVFCMRSVGKGARGQSIAVEFL